MLDVEIKLVEHGLMPQAKTSGAVCLDAYSRLDEPLIVKPMQRAKIPLGFCVKVPDGYEMLVRGRSGMTSDGKIVFEGTVDQDYRGEVSAMFMNLSDVSVTINDSERIAQLAFRPLADAQKVQFQTVLALDETERGNRGFGHTGL